MLPILPLKAVLAPKQVFTVHIEDERYIRLVRRCVSHAGELGVAFCADYKNELASLSHVGCLAKINQIIEKGEDGLEVELEGLQRFSFSETAPKLDIHYAVDVHYAEDTVDITAEDPLLEQVFQVYQQYMSKLELFDIDMLPKVCLRQLHVESSFDLLQQVSMPLVKKQEALEILSVKNRFIFILSCLRSELDMLSFVASQESGLPSYRNLLN